MKFPELSHQHYFALGEAVCTGGQIYASDLKRRFEEVLGSTMSGPRFYQLIDRMVERNWLDRLEVPFDCDGRTVVRTAYRITAAGRKSLDACREFNLTIEERLALEHPKDDARRRQK